MCEVAVASPPPCQLARCQNGAPCLETAAGAALCQCPPGFEGQRCEKLVGVDFVDRDSYVQLQDVKNWLQANITLQVKDTCTHAHTERQEQRRHPHTSRQIYKKNHILYVCVL